MPKRAQISPEHEPSEGSPQQRSGKTSGHDSSAAAHEYDVLILGGTVVDGTGADPRVADVGVRGEHIVFIGAVPQDAHAQTTIDATRLIVAPGFVDVHTHADFTVESVPAAHACVRQGVTTVVTGNCGTSAFPAPALGVDFESYAARVEATEPAVNLAALVGHGALRTAVVGADRRAATVEETGRMADLLDVAARQGAFGLSTGLSITPELLARLKPQLVRELIDDRLKSQEIQHRKIVVSDADVASAIGNVEARNGLPHGGLREKLAKQGVSFGTLIEQTRTSLGWTRVLRQELAQRGFVTPAEVAEQEALFKKQMGQPQYHVAEIFVAAEDPSRQNDARKFADTVIQQLRAGAPFGIVAAEFSQSDTALKGGDLGWVRPDQLDPQIAALVTQMPTGAISNPIRVAGGFDVIALQDKRLIGNDMATVMSLRQAFYPFTSALDPQNPTEQQKAALLAAQGLSKSATSCDAVEAANVSQGSKRASNPGDVRLDRMNPQMQVLLKSLEPGHASKALVTPEGVMVLMVCKSEQKNLAAMTRDDIADQLIQERVELASRQLQQDLKRRALIDQRQS